MKIHARNVEGIYWNDFSAQVSRSFPETSLESPERAEEVSWSVSSGRAIAAAEKQQLFFKAVDKYELEPHQTSASVGPSRRKDPYDLALAAAVDKLPKSYRKTNTVVMEAAFFLLQQGLLNIPDVGTINVKQARAFLWNAAWLQEHMNDVWNADTPVPMVTVRKNKLDAACFSLAIVGPGGTGKTAVLKATEALTIFFAGPETVKKLAPSNAAARLLGGDTIHALCKLPYGKARPSSKRGRF